MDCIVLELQKEALDKNADIESLLRKAYAIARKLKLSEFEEWVQCEQNGYGEKAVPGYRMIRGQMEALNPIRGWIPVVMGYSMPENFFDKTKLSNPISELWNLYRDADGQVVVVNLPSIKNKYILKCYGAGTKFRLQFEKNKAYSILNTVRNHILEWSLLLEENGIVGKNYSFSDDEKKIAQEKTEIVNYTSNFWNNTEEVQAQQENMDLWQDMSELPT